jgi:hypothetical protein
MFQFLYAYTAAISLTRSLLTLSFQFFYACPAAISLALSLLTLSFLSLPASCLCHQGVLFGPAKAVNYDPFIYQGHYLPYGLTPYYILAEVATVFSRGAGKEGLTGNFLTHLFNQVTIYLVAFSHNINRGHYFSKINCLVLAGIKAIIHIWPSY